MNRRQKLVQQQFLNNEQAVIKRLEQVYGVALKDIDGKIEKLMKRFDPETGDLPQSAVYQIQYQKMLKSQVEGILQQLQTQQFLTVSDYLNVCYEDGFVGSLFDLHGQDIPLMMPMDQTKLIRAVQLDSKISQGLYTRLGEDVGLLKKKITAQVSRSIATGTSYAECAKQLAGYTRIGYNNSIRIARTEGHRIQTTAAMDAMEQAKARGADVVKQWDSTLDGKTRESHVAVDGQIRELDEKFSNGLMYPGDPAGGAAEVINCRCALLQRARWALDDGFTKWDNFAGNLESFDSPASYDEFKKSFFSDENRKYMNYVQQMEQKYGTKDFRTVLDMMTDREYRHYSRLLANNPIYNVKAPAKPVFTPSTMDDFPGYFRKNSASKKATKTFVDALNEVEDLDPNIRKLYTHMGDLPGIPADCTVSYTGKGHAVTSWVSRSTGEVTKCTVKVPKMLGDDLKGQLSTAFHEMGHLIDLGAGKNGKWVSRTYQKLTDAIRSSGKAIPDDIKNLFSDFAKQYETVRDTLSKVYREQRSTLTSDYRAGKISYSDYKKQWNALIREEEAERDYQCRNLCGGGVSMLSDIYDALSGGSYRDNGTLIYGHGGKYYRQAGSAEAEIFANYMSLSVNNPDLIDMLRKDKPDLCDALDQMIEEMAGGIND